MTEPDFRLRLGDTAGISVDIPAMGLLQQLRRKHSN